MNGRCNTSLAVVARPAGCAAARPRHGMAMSLVPTAAALLAVWAKPAGRTHCQQRHRPAANGCHSAAARASPDRPAWDHSVCQQRHHEPLGRDIPSSSATHGCSALVWTAQGFSSLSADAEVTL